MNKIKINPNFGYWKDETLLPNNISDGVFEFENPYYEINGSYINTFQGYPKIKNSKNGLVKMNGMALTINIPETATYCFLVPMEGQININVDLNKAVSINFQNWHTWKSPMNNMANGPLQSGTFYLSSNWNLNYRIFEINLNKGNYTADIKYTGSESAPTPFGSVSFILINEKELKNV